MALAVLDLPFTPAFEQRLRDERAVRLRRRDDVDEVGPRVVAKLAAHAAGAKEPLGAANAL